MLRVAVPEGAPAGLFRLKADNPGDSVADGAPGPVDVVLVQHASGTSSWPEIVPLLQSNVAASATHIADSLALGGRDRCLNVMPLFHIHGLLAAVSASLYAGAPVACAPGFDAMKFFGHVKEVRPTCERRAVVVLP